MIVGAVRTADRPDDRRFVAIAGNPGEEAGLVISAYRLSDEERAAVAAGADLYLALTCVDGRSINPQQLIVGKEACAAAFGLSPDPETP